MKTIITSLAIALTITGIMLGLVGLIRAGIANNREYNAHVCAVYGYEPDCKTPLSIERRLK